MIYSKFQCIMQTLQKKTRASRRKYKMEGRGKKEGEENKTRREKILHVTSVFSGGRGREKEGGYVEIVGVRVREGEIDI